MTAGDEHDAVALAMEVRRLREELAAALLENDKWREAFRNACEAFSKQPWPNALG